MQAKSIPLTLGAATLLVGSISAHAQTIQNASFENPTVASREANPSDGYYTGAPDNFTLYNYSGTLGGSTFVNGTASGAASLFINSFNPGEGVYQDLGALQPLTTYTLTYAATTGVFQSGNDVIENVSFYNGMTPSGTLLALSSHTVNDPTHTFADFTLTYTTGATVTGDLTVLLAIGNVSQNTGQADYDNLRLAAVSDVPEPSTWAAGLIGVGVLGCFALRRRSLAAA